MPADAPVPTSVGPTPRTPLPVQPQLRGDAVVLVPRNGDLRLVLSSRQMVTVGNAPSGLAEWLLLLDGTRSLQEVLIAAPLPADDAQYLLAELDRAGLLADANEGLLFRRTEAFGQDALRMAQQTRAGATRPRAGRTAEVVVAVTGSPEWVQPLRSAIELPGIKLQQGSARADLLAIVGETFDRAVDQAAARAMAAATPHLVVAVSAVDAVLLPLTVPGRTACRRCWAMQRDGRDLDWDAWTFGGRRPDPPRLPTHHKALVLSMVVEHLLACLPAVREPQRASAVAAASMERYVDLRRGSVDREPVRPHPACGCTRAAA